MVDTFTTTENTYSFEIDGQPLTLPRPAWSEYEEALEAIETGPKEQFEFVKALLARKADERTLVAVQTLSIGQLSSLFQGWLGLSPGESSSSSV